MKTSKHLIAGAVTLSTLFLAAGTAQAQAQASGRLYGEIGLAQITYKALGLSLKPSALRAIVGTEVHPNLAVEGMVGFGMTDDSTTIGGVRVTGEIDHMWGLFVKPKASVAPGLDVFARLGYAKTKIAVSVPGYRITGSDGDMAYGLGASYKLTENFSANVDYMSYYNKDGVKGAGFTVGLGFKF